MKKYFSLLILLLLLAGCQFVKNDKTSQSSSESQLSSSTKQKEQSSSSSDNQSSLSQESQTASQEYQTKYSILAGGQRVGNEQDGYVNLPKDWTATTNPDDPDKTYHYYTEPSKQSIVVLKKFTEKEMTVKGHKGNAEELTNFIYDSWKENPNFVNIKKIAGNENSFIIDVELAGGINRVMLVIPAQDGGVNYVAVEGPKETFTELTKAVTGSYDQTR